MSHACQSCGMIIDSGIDCACCIGANGELQPFEERFERMVQWQLGREPDMPRDTANNVRATTCGGCRPGPGIRR